MAWTAEDWQRARDKYRAAYRARLDAVRAVTFVPEDVRDRLDEAAGQPGRELNEAAARLGPADLPGYEARDERLAGAALGRVDNFISRFRVTDTTLRREATPEDFELLMSAGWADALANVREAAGRPLEQPPLTVPGRRPRASSSSARRMRFPWPLLLVAAGLLLRKKG